jgi:hypothetical protein
VVALGVAQPVRLGVGIGSNAQDLLCQVLDSFNQTEIATQRRRAVKLHVAVVRCQEITRVDRVAVLPLERL